MESRVGAGTVFTIYLPALKVPVSAINGQEAVPVPAPAEQEMILLVEDHEPTRVAIRDTLEMLGYDVMVAETGQEALPAIARKLRNVLERSLAEGGRSSR